MATTTNYGWTTPDDTALVKDGASAIRTLGTSVDTTTKNLNPETTLGDISFRSSTSNVNTRLGIGTTGQVLSVSGGVPAWATASSGGMTLLSTTTLTGSATTLSSISSSYKQLLFILTNITPDTANAALRITVNSNSTSIYGQIALEKDGGSGTTHVENNATSWRFTTSTGLRNSDTLSDGYIYFTDYTNAVVRKNGYYGWNYIGNGNTLCAKAGNLIWTDPAAITSATFTLSTGSFTLGTIKTYGVS